MNNSDTFLVNRSGQSHKVRLDTLKTSITEDVSQDITDLNNADAQLNQKVDSLTQTVNQNKIDSDSADTSLSNRISVLEGDAGPDLSGYATKQELGLETNARISNDSALDSKINTEINNRVNGDNTLSNEIDGVEQRVDSLETKVDALEAGGGVDLSAYIKTVDSDAADNNIRTEFRAKDNDLQANINAETAARVAGDNLLRNQINARSISPMDLGAAADENQDDTTYIQQCIDIVGDTGTPGQPGYVRGTRQTIDWVVGTIKLPVLSTLIRITFT